MPAFAVPAIFDRSEGSNATASMTEHPRPRGGSVAHATDGARERGARQPRAGALGSQFRELCPVGIEGAGPRVTLQFLSACGSFARSPFLHLARDVQYGRHCTMSSPESSCTVIDSHAGFVHELWTRTMQADM